MRVLRRHSMPSIRPRAAAAGREAIAAFVLVVGALCLRPAGVPNAAEQPWPFLPIEDVGARTFLAQHPEYDGRGVVVAVLDTGVDVSTPGLTETSQGFVKVVDTRDFTGRGRIELTPAERVEKNAAGAESTGSALKVADGLWLEGLDALAVPPVDEDHVYTGVLDEASFRNSGGLHDLDDNGTTDDRWGLVVYAAAREQAVAVLGPGRGVEDRWTWGDTALAEEEKAARSNEVWIFVIDRDRDGELADETLMRDYPVNYDSFNLRDRQVKDARQVLQITVDLRIEDDEPSLNLHYDDGGHGTHVAGIATGFSIHGQVGLNGVAPGARVISCKLGDNSLSGGSTRTESMKKAYEYAADYQKRYGVPVVVNMSYGIGSEIEGDAEMESFLDTLLDEHSDLVVCNSAGNLGPGISSVGLPAASSSVISCAALLTKEAARDLYGATFTRDELFAFSSRGGEVAKPDVAAPGAASSTVPPWGTRDRKQGTSMASPEVTGSVACMLSGLAAEDLDWSFGTIKRAILATAKPLPGYNRIEAGAGVLDLTTAYEAARAYARAGEAGLVTIYDVETEAPAQPDGESSAAYWRTGAYFPRPPQTQEFTIKPRFATSLSKDDRNRFYRAFRLESKTSWIRLDRKETYVNGDGTAQIDVTYDAKALAEPGLYVGRVLATEKGGRRSGTSAYEFELVATIVVPNRFDLGDEYQREWKARSLKPGQNERAFVEVPDGATSMDVNLATAEDAKARVHVVLFDPDGRRVESTRYLTLEGPGSERYTVAGDDLALGVWEIDTVAAFSPDITSLFDLSVEFAGLQASPAVVEELEFDDPGERPRISLDVTPVFDQRFHGSAAGEIDRYWRKRTVDVKDADTWKYEFHVDESVHRVEFTLELAKETYNTMTDCAVNIADDSGKYLVSDGFGQRTMSLALDDPSPGAYTLEVIAGFTSEKDEKSWNLDVEERHILAEPVHLEGEVRDAATFDLYPFVPTEVKFTADGVPPRAPEGFANAGELRWTDARESRVRLRVPVRVGMD